MKYSHIVFDIDGTLIDTERAVLMSCQKMLLKIKGIEKNLDELRFVLGITDKDALHKMDIEDIEYAENLWGELFRQYSYEIHVFDGIKRILTELKNNSVKLGIITSETYEEYNSGFLRFGLDKYFDTVICADDTHNHKPTGEPMEKYLQNAKAQKEETLYIGDSMYDMQCTSNAGVDAALAMWGRQDRGGIKSTYYLDNPKEIFNILNNN